MLKEKISLLPDSHRDALAADIDAIMYTTEGDVRIYYDDDGMFRILKCFSNKQSYFLGFLLNRYFHADVVLSAVSHSLFPCL